MTTDPTTVRPAPYDLASLPKTAGGWLAAYVFYSANPRPLLVDCIQPLVADLRGRGLVSGYFFINYWLAGPHVRLRLKPTTAEHAPEVRARTEEAISGFLRDRPALFEMKPEYMVTFYSRLFDLEFPDEESRREYVDADGRMVFRPNNSFRWEAYEPEYGRYGGPIGIQTAEWHFEHSSDMVLAAMAGLNSHVRTVRLGLAAQIMTVAAAAFLGSREAAVAFLEGYHGYWYGSFADAGRTAADSYDQHYEAIAPAIRERVDILHRAVEREEFDRLPRFARQWHGHLAELHRRVSDHADRGELTFAGFGDAPNWVPDSTGTAARMLLMPYMHMTNNRFTVNIRDEAYLSYVVARALRETAPEEVPAA